MRGIEAGSRRSLAKCLSLCESRLLQERSVGESAARFLVRNTAMSSKVHRVGFTGPPGAGKSSLIEAVGSLLLQQDAMNESARRVGVLCVDPSSALTGGSVLGDRTRMSKLAVADNCFIRASASGGDEGGLNGAARHQLLALEGWVSLGSRPDGFVLVETVGVGQSEHEVDGVVDTMVLALSPGGGDQLQGMKRGITELADIVVITKCDGDLEAAANRAASDYRASLHLLSTRKLAGWDPPVLRVSASTGKGLSSLLSEIARHRAALGNVRKARIEKEWSQLWMVVGRKHLARLQSDAAVVSMLPNLKNQLEKGEINIDMAAETILKSV